MSTELKTEYVKENPTKCLGKYGDRIASSDIWLDDFRLCVFGTWYDVFDIRDIDKRLREVEDIKMEKKELLKAEICCNGECTFAIDTDLRRLIHSVFYLAGRLGCYKKTD
jgi:hypothetical protein